MSESADVEREHRIADVRRRYTELDQLGPVDWAEGGYVPALFGGVSVLITPELATQIRTFHEERS